MEKNDYFAFELVLTALNFLVLQRGVFKILFSLCYLLIYFIYRKTKQYENNIIKKMLKMKSIDPWAACM